MSELKEGQIVWTCEPSVESLNYGGELVEPKQVKVHFGGMGVPYGHIFNKETGEIDDDSNAKCILGKFFLDKKEVNKYYEDYLTDFVIAAQDRLNNWLDRRE